MSVVTIGLDLAKTVFQVNGVDGSRIPVLRRRLARADMLAFFTKQPPCVVGMEACSSAHHWARLLTKIGHVVRLIPPQYVKSFVKRNKTDAADAEAICEAVAKPNMLRTYQDRGAASGTGSSLRSQPIRASEDGDDQCLARAAGRVRYHRRQRLMTR